MLLFIVWCALRLCVFCFIHVWVQAVLHGPLFTMAKRKQHTPSGSDEDEEAQLAPYELQRLEMYAVMRVITRAVYCRTVVTQWDVLITPLHLMLCIFSLYILCIYIFCLCMFAHSMARNRKRLEELGILEAIKDLEALAKPASKPKYGVVEVYAHVMTHHRMFATYSAHFVVDSPTLC